MLLRSSLKNQGQTYQTCVFCTDSDRQFYKLWREGTHLIVLVKRYSCRKYGAVGYFHDLLHHEPAELLNSRCFHCLSFKRDQRMVHKGDLVVIGISVGLALGILIASLIFFGIWWYKKRSNLRQCSNERILPTLPIRMNGLGTSNDFSASLASSITIRGSEHPQKSSPVSSWWNHHSKDQFASASGILRYSYKDIQKATQKFTTVLGQGSFGPVYKAVMPTGEVLAVKVLASNSKQGEKEFQTEVADFGLSNEEVFDEHTSGLKGTYGYIDPVYVSTNKFTVKSDIYSFGVIIFELITAIHPHQNLMEYVNLAGMSPDGVDEILDKKLVGECNIEEVRDLAAIAHKCLQKFQRKRPSIGEVSQAILKIKQRLLDREMSKEFSRVLSRIEDQQMELSRMASIKDGD
ncbi:calcium/calmodulin-regulated receptor-like kinase 2 isoform X4 [Populus trichocarpa]|uniref:calcium/calmodulin-regulated receptor-like kinase 2 isoform X4 n=1 Tax=Populus trichocarpa TaxID=3694 RepID=UPI000D18AF86|nr:calcium/calmodulin-regulated receptor-like kinase 2 isoform X4 [Populus trichocarpa]|eukprot:XP_024454490.1 calcium/calmodulin-regulated receptor-like kinase 2 isoform X4 [Populus trichocarpa]